MYNESGYHSFAEASLLDPKSSLPSHDAYKAARDDDIHVSKMPTSGSKPEFDAAGVSEQSLPAELMPGHQGQSHAMRFDGVPFSPGHHQAQSKECFSSPPTQQDEGKVEPASRGSLSILPREVNLQPRDNRKDDQYTCPRKPSVCSLMFEIFLPFTVFVVSENILLLPDEDHRYLVLFSLR